MSQVGDKVSAISALLGLARLERVQGRLHQAARLFGAADALLEATGTSAEAVFDGEYHSITRRPLNCTCSSARRPWPPNWRLGGG